MKIEELEELADNAIARWENPNRPRLPGEATVKFCSPSGRTDLLPGLAAQRIGTTRTGLEVMLVKAADLKRAIAHQFLKNSAASCLFILIVKVASPRF